MYVVLYLMGPRASSRLRPAQNLYMFYLDGRYDIWVILSYLKSQHRH